MWNATSVNYPAKHLLLLLLVLTSIIFWGCKDDDDPLQLSTCSEGDTYVLDFNPVFFQETRIWLTENDGDVAFDEQLTTTTFGTQFLNFEEACENEYTASFASYEIEASGNSALIAERLFINEYAQVPSGSVLEQTVFPRTFGGNCRFEQA